MSDQNTAGNGAPETDPAADFVTQEYVGGVLVEESPAKPAAAPKPAAAEPTAQADGDDGQLEGQTEGEQAPAKPNKTPARERIDELTHQWRTEQRRAERLEQELQALRAPAKPETPAAPQASDPAATPAQGEKKGPPSAADFQFGEFDPEFVRANARYEARLALQEIEDEKQQAAAQVAQQTEHQAIVEKFQTQRARGAEVYEDYEDKVVIGAEMGKWHLSADMAKLLVESEVGHDIAYHLASHPEEAARVYRQSPVEQARYFGRLEAKFSAEEPAAPAKAEQVPTLRAPKAPVPVTPARGAGGKFQVTGDSDDFLAIERAHNGR